MIPNDKCKRHVWNFIGNQTFIRLRPGRIEEQRVGIYRCAKCGKQKKGMIA